MSTFAVVNDSQILPAVNYLLSNLDVNGVPANVLVANTATGVISQSGNTTPVGYLYQYINIRYSNNNIGTSGFDINSNNYAYFGVYNSATPTASTNPVSYQWFEVSPPFNLATSRTLYYSALGGRQIQFVAANALPSSGFVITTANVAIDLDVVTTAVGTPGERGPVTQASVITTADPNTATTAQLTTWFEAPRDAVTPPIGTGLTPPVSGDTATFTYTGGVGQPNATLNYNGSIWVPVDGQVVNGNVIIQNTLAANAIITGSITSTQIAANTITGNRIAANTITATNITTGTLTTNLFTANTINGNIITAGTITANLINANGLIVNTVVSTGATINNFTSPGFWLDGNSGNARFGNTVSIGNSLTVGTNANIGGNLIIGTNANIGNSLTIGNLLTVGANANIGGNLRIGNNANIGNSVAIGNLLTVGANANIGGNLIIGNNASIGGNLNVTGLITTGNLNANTVNTTTIVPAAISAGAQSIVISQEIFAVNAVANTLYVGNCIAFLTTTLANQNVYAFAGLNTNLVIDVTGTAEIEREVILLRYDVTANTFTQLNSFTIGPTTLPGAGAYATGAFLAPFVGYYDVLANVGNYAYTVGQSYSVVAGAGNIANVIIVGDDATVVVQTIKR
jgi:carbonic anhydrase/acetyltransferase-like protein (isoleucine patch superfamily)